MTLTCDCGCKIKGNYRNGKYYFLCLDCAFYEERKIVVVQKKLA